MKRIKAEEERERKEMPQKLKEQKEVLYCLDTFDWPLERTKSCKYTTQKTFCYQPPSTSAFLKGIFRPPKFVVA